MDSAALDADWREKLKDDSRFSYKWYENHPITKELLKSGVLEGSVIEFGCGIGTTAYLAWTRATGCDITGVDGSTLAITRAKTICEMRTLRYDWADLLALPYRDNRFNNGYMLAVIEHIEDTDKLLSECKRVIEPGGKLFVSVTERNYHHDKLHVHSYNLRELAYTLAAIGDRIKLYVKGHIIYATVEVE